MIFSRRMVIIWRITQPAVMAVRLLYAASGMAISGKRSVELKQQLNPTGKAANSSSRKAAVVEIERLFIDGQE